LERRPLERLVRAKPRIKSKAAGIAGGFFHRLLAPSIFGTVDSGEALPHI
jgi:hypothetical protein